MGGIVDGKVIIVTGAGGGLGSGMALDLAKNGASAIVADINQEAAQKVADQITGAGGKALAVTVDVADRASTKAMIAEAVAAYGRLDVMFNNAGISLSIGTQI